MKIAHYEQIITPEVGEPVAGYGVNDVTVRIHDDLKLSVLLLDDGETKGAVLGYDLLGLDETFIRKIRRDTAAVLACPEENVILSCTHTHSGPHTRSLGRRSANLEYIAKLYRWSSSAVSAAMEKWQETELYFYSCQCDANYNRRYVDGSNSCTFLPHQRTLEPLSNGFTDQELGMLIFNSPETKHPQGVLINFAAHPLASHAPGMGSHQISADYPGALREIMEDNSCWCVFVDGAAGDQFPKDSECGWESVRKCASDLAVAAIKGVCDARRNKEKYLIENPKIKGSIERLTVKLRRDRQQMRQEMPEYAGKRETEVELQFLAFNNDVCLVGVPGEMLAEIGQEIKWHSPYKRTFILYNSTAYLSYLPHANGYVAGGYETAVNSAFIQPFESLKLVNAAVEGMRKLHGPLPEELES
ncbi:MAG: hypothetical protein IKD44_04895 [Lentisphaeria bacterium]|nr:hypothetical protein [Lentisphaeria bacterium]